MADSGRSARGPESVTRARDIDRAQVSSVLDAAYAEGQLSAHEYHDRVRRAASARTLGDLGGLTADLQSPAVFGAPPAVAPKRLGRRHFDEYPARTRARTADRAATREVLDAARADGQLDASEHRAAVKLADGARTLGELATLVTELQQRPAAPTKPRTRDLSRIATVLAAAVVAVACFVWTVRADEPPPPPVEVAAIDYDAAPPLVLPTPSPATLAGFLKVRDDYLAKFGDTVVAELVLHDTHASVQRISAANPARTDDYTYRGGFVRSPGGYSTRQRDEAPVDLSQVDADALGAVLATVVTDLAVPDGQVSHLRFDADSRTEQPAIMIFVRSEAGHSGHLTITLTGDIVRSSPYTE
ncbi:DUF1707 domain-containing protein [Nocardia sp. NPDC058176]|uniref:DUF1707 SHOCT-like domain-containing protein n=1 Tax=Nocardia sp. NPDC058176 TaxID=3346368 RepID=UPI0036DC69C9